MPTFKMLRRKAASEYLAQTHGVHRAASTLAKLAVIGGGPVFRRINAVPFYTPDDLDGWVASKLSPPMRSTSDVPQAKPVLPSSPEKVGRGVEPSTAEAIGRAESEGPC